MNGVVESLKSTDVRAIIALMVAFTFCVLAGMDRISADDFVKVVFMIAGFYFGSKAKGG